ncbi:LAMI_0H16006g1_1 [Lachancea mirantina]|uniref:LAMI_0H16006g1_1 n=1 Tax=Lachancea mirantina TaxID=1230905 RepID=A0A1G4KJ62_9SACH|nr:LAMI_0H16006g1_1 [Lachancea mirantina]
MDGSSMSALMVSSNGHFPATQALQLWENGVLKEREGSMMDAITCYRQALKLDEGVEKTYRRKVLEDLRLAKQLRELKIDNGSGGDKNEAETEIMAGEEGHGTLKDQEAEEIKPCWILDMLPKEILLQIVHHVVRTSSESWLNLSLANSTFNALCFGDPAPYKTFAHDIYALQHYDEASMMLNGVSNLDSLETTLWQGDCAKMLRERPYVKFEGIYISTVNYLRHGANPEGSLSLIRPVHMITYYRYFRFYPDGTCLRLLSTDQPSFVVKSFAHENNVRHAEICHWSLSLDDNFSRLVITRSNEKYRFQETLEIKNQAHKRHHRFMWVESCAFDKEDKRLDFGMRNEKPFYFSRVKSYVTRQ